MKRKLVQSGVSLAVPLPATVVKALGLKKGQVVDVSVHPVTGAVTVRPGITYFEGGKVTKNFERLAEETLKRHHQAFQNLAK
jgi:antitoxin component of MazEF toxin-antitoxin module